MLDMVITFITTVFGWVGDLLPDSPFDSFFTVLDTMHTGIAWLNWLCPVGECLALATVWVVACVAVVVAENALDLTTKIAKKVVGE